MPKIRIILKFTFIVLIVSAMFGKIVCQESLTNREPTKLENYSFPEGTINCLQGDYIIKNTGENYWQVFFVEDIVLISHLIPFNKDNSKFIEQINIADSALPPRYGEIYLLVTLFGNKFQNIQEATQAIDNGELDLPIENLCKSTQDFPQKQCKLYKKKK